MKAERSPGDLGGAILSAGDNNFLSGGGGMQIRSDRSRDILGSEKFSPNRKD